jgi:hypothetical protein
MTPQQFRQLQQTYMIPEPEEPGVLSSIGNRLAQIPAQAPLAWKGLTGMFSGAPPNRPPGEPPPELQNSHGGSTVTGWLNSLYSGVTAPRDTYEGKVDLNTDEGMGRVMDMAGVVMPGGIGGTGAAEGVALGSGPIRNSRLVGPNGKPLEIPAKTTYDIPASDRSKQLQGMYEPTTELLPQKTINIEDLQRQNAVLIPMPGDKTAAGQRIIGVNGQRFETPVDQLGGLNFSRAEAAQGNNPSGWASTAQGAKPLLSRTQRVAEETGRDPVWAFYPLGDKSSDFTRQGWRTYDQLLRQNGGEQGVARLSEGLPFGPSLEEMRNWYETTTGGERSKVFKQIAKTKGRLEAGGVDPANVRQLLQDPALSRANEGDIGYGFVKPTGTITDTPSFKHYDYSHHLGGENIGRFEPGTEVPFSTAFPDVFAQNPGWHDLQPQGVSHGVKTKMPYQVVDQELVDRIMKQQELQRMYGGQWQTGGGQR